MKGKGAAPSNEVHETKALFDQVKMDCQPLFRAGDIAKTVSLTCFRNKKTYSRNLTPLCKKRGWRESSVQLTKPVSRSFSSMNTGDRIASL